MPYNVAANRAPRHVNRADDCGCNLPKVDVGISIRATKTELGRGEWTVQFANRECFPVFLTMASGDAAHGHDGPAEDFDTECRDLKVCPGETASIKIPRCGNGVEYNAPFRVTARNQRAAVVGELKGEFPRDARGC